MYVVYSCRDSFVKLLFVEIYLPTISKLCLNTALSKNKIANLFSIDDCLTFRIGFA